MSFNYYVSTEFPASFTLLWMYSPVNFMFIHMVLDVHTSIVLHNGIYIEHTSDLYVYFVCMSCHKQEYFDNNFQAKYVNICDERCIISLEKFLFLLKLLKNTCCSVLYFECCINYVSFMIWAAIYIWQYCMSEA